MAVEKLRRKLKDGSYSVRYRVRYRDPSGRQRSKSFERRADAENYDAQLRVDLRRSEWVDPKKGKLRYRKWVTKWRQITPELAPSTEARNESFLRNHILPEFGDAALAEINHLWVRTWLASLSASGLAPATVRECYGLLKRSLSSAVAAGLIAQNPCTDVPLPKIEPTEMRILRPAEVARLAGAIHRGTGR